MPEPVVEEPTLEYEEWLQMRHLEALQDDEMQRTKLLIILEDGVGKEAIPDILEIAGIDYFDEWSFFEEFNIVSVNTKLNCTDKIKELLTVQSVESQMMEVASGKES